MVLMGVAIDRLADRLWAAPDHKGFRELSRRKFATRLAEFDVRDRLAPLPGWVSQIFFALVCIGVEVILRLIVNQFAPDAAPFALLFPSVMAATLFAGWQTGIAVLAVSEALAWRFVASEAENTIWQVAPSPPIIVITISGLILIAFAEVFRRAVRNALEAADQKADESDLLRREIDHRIKNNFQMAASLVDMQRRRADDEAVKDALSQVLNRLQSFAEAHRQLYHDAAGVGSVDMRDYIGSLCDSLSDGLTLSGAIALRADCAAVSMPRDRAVLAGLIVNELVTNAAKHAFEGRETGLICVSLKPGTDGNVLVVEDNGCGFRQTAEAEPSGLGKRLVEAFVRQADATMTIESDASGTCCRIQLPDQ